MKWIRIWTKETFAGTTFQELNAEERGIWFSLLVMAGLDSQPKVGEIALRKGIPYPISTLASLLNTSTKSVQNTIKLLEKHNKVTLKNGGIIRIKNWKKYQTEYARCKYGKGNEPLDVKSGKRPCKKSDVKNNFEVTDIDRDIDREKDNIPSTYISFSKEFHKKQKENHPNLIKKVTNKTPKSSHNYCDNKTNRCCCKPISSYTNTNN